MTDWPPARTAVLCSRSPPFPHARLGPLPATPVLTRHQRRRPRGPGARRHVTTATRPSPHARISRMTFFYSRGRVLPSCCISAAGPGPALCLGPGRLCGLPCPGLFGDGNLPRRRQRRQPHARPRPPLPGALRMAHLALSQCCRLGGQARGACPGPTASSPLSGGPPAGPGAASHPHGSRSPPPNH